MGKFKYFEMKIKRSFMPTISPKIIILIYASQSIVFVFSYFMAKYICRGYSSIETEFK